MTRYISSIIIFALLIACMLVSFYYSDKVLTEISYLLDLEIDAVRFSMANDLVSTDHSNFLASKEKWEGWKLMFFTIAPHDKVDMICVEFDICTAWSATENDDEYYASLWNIKSLLSVIKRLDMPHISRIF